MKNTHLCIAVVHFVYNVRGWNSVRNKTGIPAYTRGPHVSSAVTRARAHECIIFLQHVFNYLL